MAVTIAEAEVAVTADGSKVPKDIASDVNRGSGIFGSAGMGIGKALVAGVIGLGIGKMITGYLGGAITNASDLNETINKSNTIFGANAAEMERWGSGAVRNLGLSKGAALTAASGFGDMFSQIGFTSGAAADMSRQVVQMSADLGSFSNLDTADVADRMSAAFRGEYDSLQAVIPNINAARVESEAMAATGKKTAKELTAQEKATAVLAIVQKDGARAMGDFAKTSDGYANSQKIAAAQAEELSTKVGGLLLPAMNGVMGFVNDTVLPGLSSMVDWLGQNRGEFEEVASVAGGILGPIFETIGDILTNNIVPAFTAVGGWIAGNIGYLTTLGTVLGIMAVGFGLVAGAVGIFNAVLALSPVTWIILGIVALTAAVVALAMNWDTVVAWITTVWGGFIGWITDLGNSFLGWWNGLWGAVGAWITNTWNGFVGFVRDLFWGYISWAYGVGNGFLGWWNGLWSAVGNFIKSTWNGFVGFVRGLFQGYVSWLMGVGNGVRSWWSGLWSAVGSFLSSAWSGMVNTAKNYVNVLFNSVVSLKDKILGFFGGAAGWLLGAGRNIIEGLGRGITNALSGLLSTVRNIAGSIVNTAKSALGIHSPSRVFEEEVGVMLPKGAELGVRKGAKSLNRTIANMIDVPAMPNAMTVMSGMPVSAPRPVASNASVRAPEERPTVHIEHLTLDAKNVRELTDLVAMVQALPQVARAGRSARGTVG